jgi:hypothetical protein
MVEWSVRSACDRGSYAPVSMASLRMGDQNLLSRVPLCFGRHVKPLVPAAFAVVSIHQSALGPRGGLWPVLLVEIHKEGLCPSSGDINRLMMI